VHQAARERDPVAEQLAVVDDQVLDADADTKVQVQVLRRARFVAAAARQACLQVHRPADRIHHARELEHHVLGRQLDGLAAVLGRARLDQLGAGGTPGVGSGGMGGDRVVPAHHLGAGQRRKPPHDHAGALRAQRLARQQALHLDRGHHEAVAAAGDGGDRLRTDEPADRRDLHRQVVFLDHEAGPDHVEQFALGDDTVAPLDQRQQHVEGTRADRRRYPGDQQRTFFEPQLEIAERDAARHRTSCGQRARRPCAGSVA
jgi:hypothetical protein